MTFPEAEKAMLYKMLLQGSQGYIVCKERTITATFRSTLLAVKVRVGIYVPFNSQGHIGTDPQHLSLVGLELTQR